MPGNRIRATYHRTISFQPGEHKTNQRVAVAAVPAYTISGVVENHARGSGGRLEIRLLDALVDSGSGCASHAWFADRDSGPFRFEAVPRGRYRMRVELVRDCDGCVKYEATRSLNVEADLHAVRVAMFPGMSLTGTSHLDDGVARAPGLRLESLTDPEGSSIYPENGPEFRVANVPPGAYRLRPTERFTGAYLKEVRLNGSVLRDGILRVGPGQRTGRLQLNWSSQVANVELQVSTARGSATSHTAVLLGCEDPRAGTPYTVADERTRLQSIPPGSYRLLVIVPPVPPIALTADRLRRLEKHAVPVTLAPGANVVRAVAVNAYEAAP